VEFMQALSVAWSQNAFYIDNLGWLKMKFNLQTDHVID
jgi:hypothetical protein